MTVEDFPHFAVWSKRGAPFVSLEAWTGHGDPDGFDGDIHGKAVDAVAGAWRRGAARVRMRFEAG